MSNEDCNAALCNRLIPEQQPSVWGECLSKRPDERSDDDSRFESIVAYMGLMVDEGMMPDSDLPNLCHECFTRYGVKRPAIFGEDFCTNCWDGRWCGSTRRP